MKNVFKFVVAALVLVNSDRATAQQSASANCFATIVSIHDTAKLDHAHGAGKGGARTASLKPVASANSGVEAQPMLIKGDFINLSAIGKRRKLTRTANNTVVY